jgi:hypothetical protein
MTCESWGNDINCVNMIIIIIIIRIVWKDDKLREAKKEAELDRGFETRVKSARHTDKSRSDLMLLNKQRIRNSLVYSALSSLISYLLTDFMTEKYRYLFSVQSIWNRTCNEGTLPIKIGINKADTSEFLASSHSILRHGGLPRRHTLQ